MKKARWFMVVLVLVLFIASPVEVYALATDWGDGVSASSFRNGGNVRSTSTQTQTNGFSEEEIAKIQTDSAFEKVVSKFFLQVGDYAHDYLTQLFREEITIDKIVFNKVELLNANFFNNSAKPSKTDASTIVKKAINRWYETFRTVALLICVVGIVVAGIKIMLGTPEGKNNAKDILKKVVLGVMLVYFFPFVMKMGFDINDAIITMVQDQIISGSVSKKVAGLKETSELVIDEELEFRSPIYVSNASRKLTPGSEEASDYFVSKLQTYTKNVDVMRIMRAYAGVSLRFMFIIIWYLLLIQTYFMVYTYLKRYITIAFLLCIYPLTIIGYVVGGLLGRAKTAFNEWCSRFFGNVFMQTIHAVTYGVISSILIDQVERYLPNNINWILMVVAISFLFTGERILDNLWRLATSASEGKGEIKDMLKKPKDAFKTIRGK